MRELRSSPLCGAARTASSNQGPSTFVVAKPPT